MDVIMLKGVWQKQICGMQYGGVKDTENKNYMNVKKMQEFMS